jgi:hypothetical protein
MRALLFCLILCSISCAKKTLNVEQNSTSNSSLAQLAEDILGKENTEVANDSKTFTLVYQNKNETTQTVKYVVLDNLSKTVISKGSFKAGYIKWKTENSLEILDIPGIIPKDKTQADYIKIINLPVNKK